MQTIRIGSGAGYGGDRVEPAVTLMERGNLDFICFECLAERTIALAQKERKNFPDKGYNHLLEYRMEKVLPLAHANKVKVITNMGAANPLAAMEVVNRMAKAQGLSGLKIAAVLGDDVLSIVRTQPHLNIIETGEPLASISDKIISANAYLGARGIVEALQNGADVVITGRVADPALYLAPMIFSFGWDAQDFDLLGKGTMIGHLLECAGQVCGGYFADPGKKEVADLWNIGFPLVEVDASGQGFITKISGTGGQVTTATCTEQLLYEIHDPENYYTPDCIADFSRVVFTPTGKDQVAFSQATGKPATETYKVSVGYYNGFLGEGQISYGGANCLARAQLALEVVRKRLGGLAIADARFELIGVNALSPFADAIEKVPEVRLRVAGRVATQELARQIGQEVETLYTNGPAGGGGASQQVVELVSIVSVLLPKNEVELSIVYSET